ncbi:DUF3047 domain-containing protein [Conexibacter sp. SYSU D00693]|uniref:DUF3047 domain-containing protein n=1 Tax=Conexibacter sp. SYSU D00693 TaxID=2812560 RepID=UPI00196B5765|nr:DUF3047 domain-containing protein [Conexibacter sp. SYSU D00693]
MAGPVLRRRGKLYELRVAARAFAAGRARRRAAATAAPEPDLAALERLRELLATDDRVRDARLVELPAHRPPWTATGIALDAGDQVSTFATGRTFLSQALDIWVGPHFQLWFRVGARAPVFRGTRATHTFTAATGGPLELASYFPGEWSTKDGGLATDPAVYRRAKGALHVVVVRWVAGTDVVAAVQDLAAADTTDLLAAEAQRPAALVPPPPSWRHTWILGDSEVFTPAPHDGPDAIGCHTHADVAIVQHDVDVPLTDTTLLRWRWRIDELPSQLPEDTLATHDYLSIALEFDDGQDLTWHWSSSLPVEHAYRCPIPTWHDRETHVVVRSGTDRLGEWLDEERPVRRDYANAIGEPPQRIVRVWLIAVSLFQRGTGKGAFAGIELVDGEDHTAVGP